MSFEIKLVNDLPMQASPNVGGGGIAQYTAVVIDVAGGSGPFDCIQATATTQPILGVNQSVGGPTAVGATSPVAVAAGQSMEVRAMGVTKAIAGGAITAGQFVQVNSSGQFVAITSLNPATTPTDTYVCGQALTPATASGDIFSLLLLPGLATLVTS